MSVVPDIAFMRIGTLGKQCDTDEPLGELNGLLDLGDEREHVNKLCPVLDLLDGVLLGWEGGRDRSVALRLLGLRHVLLGKLGDQLNGNVPDLLQDIVQVVVLDSFSKKGCLLVTKVQIRHDIEDALEVTS